MRPRPIKPHVVHCEAVEENVLRAAEEVEPVRPPLPSIHSFDGENRMEIAAFIVTTVDLGNDEVGWKKAERRVRKVSTGN